MASRLDDVIAMRDTASDLSQRRAARLVEALQVAEQFLSEKAVITDELQRIRDLAAKSHDVPVVNADVVRELLKELMVRLKLVFSFF